jgi:hypothetical protein
MTQQEIARRKLAMELILQCPDDRLETLAVIRDMVLIVDGFVYGNETGYALSRSSRAIRRLAVLESRGFSPNSIQSLVTPR